MVLVMELGICGIERRLDDKKQLTFTDEAKIPQNFYSGFCLLWQVDQFLPPCPFQYLVSVPHALALFQGLLQVPHLTVIGHSKRERERERETEMFYDVKIRECEKGMQSSHSKSANFRICLELVLETLVFDHFQRCVLNAWHTHTHTHTHTQRQVFSACFLGSMPYLFFHLLCKGHSRCFILCSSLFVKAVGQAWIQYKRKNRQLKFSTLTGWLSLAHPCLSGPFSSSQGGWSPF